MSMVPGYRSRQRPPAGRLPEVTRLILLRHAPTADTGKRLTGRLPGVDLNPVGRGAAAALSRSLAPVPLEAVYTSPALRCRRTAAAVAAPHRLRPAVLAGINETDYGAWEGRSLASLRRTALWRLAHTAPSEVVFPDGEALPQVQRRAVRACQALARKHPGGSVVVVTHGDVIRLVLAHYLGMPMDLYPRLDVDPASASTLDLSPDAPPRVRSINLMAAGA
jgi:probable phosphomutase (TIGR03848 family)